MKSLHYLICLGAVFCGSLATAQTRDLGGLWHFRTDVCNDGTEQRWFAPEHDTAGWDRMRVPGNWDTTLAYGSYTGTAWYRTEFCASRQPGRRCLLDFEGVATDAEVYLNGTRLGRHDFAFTRFGFDITEHLREEGPNVLVVRVDNSFKVGATWNWGGIRRPVTLRDVPEKGIRKVFVHADPDLASGDARVDVRVLLRGAPEGSVELIVRDAEGRRVARTEGHAAGSDEIPLSVRIPRAQLWNFDTPYLYRAEVRIESGGSCDSCSTRFGVRRIEIDGYRLLINGTETRLNGANWVPDDRFTGNTLPEETYKRDIDLMKSAGVNMARLSHQALPREVLDYLDEKGMLIFEEIPLWNRSRMVDPVCETPRRWLTELIGERFNHPSIIGWSVGNEIGRLTDNPAIGEYLAAAFRHVRRLDSARLAVYVTHTAAKQPDEPVSLADMILFNQYGAHGERADAVHRNHPGKPIFYAEYGSRATRGDLDASADYRSMVGSMYGREYLIGAAAWTFNDYRTNYRDTGTEATQNRPWGAVDAYRRKKRGYAELQRVNSPLRRFEWTVARDGDHVRPELLLEPRKPLELPACTMAGYRLRIGRYDVAGTLSAADTLPLATMHPGDTALRPAVPPMRSTGIARLEAGLISPAGYEIETLRHDLQPPQRPAIGYAESSDNSVRIHFDRHPSATAWYAVCDDGGRVRRTEPTREGYIEIDSLPFGRSCRVTLFACNGFGETQSPPITIATQAAVLPPVVLHAAVRGDRIEVAYTSQYADQCCELEYAPCDTEHPRSRTILTTLGGACNLPAIAPGQPHTLRIRRRLAYGYASAWSRPVRVEPRNEKTNPK